MPTILILAKLEAGTGNRTTAERINSYIKSNFKALLCDVGDFKTCQDLLIYLQKHGVTAVLAIHAYRAGKLLKDINVPYALIFGGTDVQCSSWNQQQQSIMAHVVAKARLIVAFSSVMKIRAILLWPSIKEDDIIIQSQGVITGRCSAYTFRDLFVDHRQEYELKHIREPKIFLFVGGIRQVKAPIYLMETLSALHKEDASIYMIIIGPKLDVTYADCCQQKAESLTGVHMFPELSPAKIHSLLRHSFALVNSSINEGMAGAILEAMDIGTPVIARCNDGNCSIITDSINGFLFNDTKEFIDRTKLLLQNEQLRNSMIRQAKAFIHTNHNADNERKTYTHIAQTLLEPALVPS